MFKDREVRDMQFVAMNISTFGGIPSINWSFLQFSTDRSLKRWHCLMHAGRTVKLLKLRSKWVRLGKPKRNIERDSLDKLQLEKVISAISENTIELTPLSSPLHLLKCLKLLHEIAIRFQSSGNKWMLVGNRLRYLHSTNYKIWRPVRLWIEYGSSSIAVLSKLSRLIFSILSNISGKLSRIEHPGSLRNSRDVNFMPCSKGLRFVHSSALRTLSLLKKSNWIVNFN